jgi:hypothetical protein
MQGAFMATSRYSVVRRLLVLGALFVGIYAVWHYAASPRAPDGAGNNTTASEAMALPIPVTVAHHQMAWRWVPSVVAQEIRAPQNTRRSILLTVSRWAPYASAH